MTLDQLINELLELKYKGLGNCEVVYADEEFNVITSIHTQIQARNDDEEGEKEEMLSNEYEILEEETIIKLFSNQNWYFGYKKEQEKIEEEKVKNQIKLNNLKMLYNLNDKNSIEHLILHLLKGIGLGDERGMSPRDIHEIIGGSNFEIRETLNTLRKNKLIESTGYARHLRFVAIEYYEQAKEIYEKKKS